MKSNLKILACVSAAVMSFATVAFAYSDPSRVNWAFHTGYLPDGFDTNDNVQLVAEGVFPNTCYRPASPKLEVNHETKTISVAPAAYQYQGMCLQVLLPYSQVMDVGLLKNGTYQILQAGKDLDPTAKFLGNLKVRLATSSSADDYLYAPVSQAYLERKGLQDIVHVSGTFTNSCMKLADMMVTVQSKVIVVQPISELSSEVSECKTGSFPFEQTAVVKGLKAGTRYLLHVRSLNGNSINSLLDSQK